MSKKSENAAVGLLIVIGETFGNKGGDFVDSSLRNAIDNASTIEAIVNTFLSEINDWRSWADVMSPWWASLAGSRPNQSINTDVMLFF